MASESMGDALCQGTASKACRLKRNVKMQIWRGDLLKCIGRQWIFWIGEKCEELLCKIKFALFNRDVALTGVVHNI